MPITYNGYRHGYPRVRRRFGRFVGYIQLLRPYTLMAPLIAGILGVLTPLRSFSFNHLIMSVYVGVVLAQAQAFGQCLNQYADVELDRVVKPYRPLPNGLVSKKEALGLSLLLAIFSISMAFTVGEFFGFVVITTILFAILYSVPSFSPRRIHPILNVGCLAFSRGFLPMLAVWSVYGDLNQGWRYALLAFLWVMGFQSSKDIPDIDGDRQFGIKTIPVVYGSRGLLAMMVVCTVLFSFFAFFVSYLILLLVPVGLLAIATTTKMSRITENTISWFLFYAGLALIYVLMFMSEQLYFF